MSGSEGSGKLKKKLNKCWYLWFKGIKLVEDMFQLTIFFVKHFFGNEPLSLVEYKYF